MAVAWSGDKLNLTPKDRSLWQKATQAIPGQRSGNVVIQVIDENSQPVKATPVRYEQTRHAFRFGTHYPYHSATYDLLQSAGINAATLWLGWADVQPERGRFGFEALDRIWNPAALHRRGLAVTAHAINWFKPRWRVLPRYLLEMPRSELPHLVYEHVQQLARQWAPYIDTFELVNEPFWVEASAIPLELDNMVRICHATALAIRDIAPHARLQVSFAEIARLPSYSVRPFDLLEALAGAGVPYDCIGLQAFDNAYAVTAPPYYYRTKTFSGMLQSVRQYAGVGKPLHVTALAAPSEPPVGKPPASFKPPYGGWDEATQALYLDAAYTYLFAEPQVQGITWWCPVDGRHSYIRGGGLLRQDLTAKPSYEALQQWMARHTTTGQVATDADGKAFIKGYAGEYQVTVGSGPLGKRVTQTIEAGVARSETVVLGHGA